MLLISFLYSLLAKVNKLNKQLHGLASRIVKKYSGSRFQGHVKTSQYNIPVKLKSGSILLFNSHTRALIKLEANEYIQLTSLDGQYLDSATNQVYFHSLLSNRFLVPLDSQELEIIEHQFISARESKTDLGLTIAPTMGCNLACGYCFQGQNKPKNQFDKEVIPAIIEHVQNQADTLNTLSITWYGGEPLMAKPALLALSDKLISLCNAHNIDYSASIVTNGYLLDPQTATALYEKGCTSAQITIDGVRTTHDKMRPKLNGHGSFEKIISNIKLVLEQTPMLINVRVNVGRDNIHECSQFLDFMEKENFGESGRFSLYFAPIDASTPESGSAFEESISKQEFNRELLKYTKLGQQKGLIYATSAPNFFMGMCVAAKNNGLVIAPNGDLHKCWETMHDTDKRIGTIYDLIAAERSRNNKLWKHWSPFDNKTCRSCKVLPLCGGMCGHRFIYFGAGNEESTPCPDWKWNTAENIFSRALQASVVKEGEWLDKEATIDTMISGERHDTSSLALSQKSLHQKLIDLGIHDDSVILLQQLR